MYNLISFTPRSNRYVLPGVRLMSGLFLYSDGIYKQAFVVTSKVRIIVIILKASLDIGHFFICSGGSSYNEERLRLFLKVMQ